MLPTETTTSTAAAPKAARAADRATRRGEPLRALAVQMSSLIRPKGLADSCDGRHVPQERGDPGPVHQRRPRPKIWVGPVVVAIDWFSKKSVVRDLAEISSPLNLTAIATRK